MPINLTEVKTPKGRSVARAEFVSEVTVEDAKRFIEVTRPGTELGKLAFLVLGNVSGISNEVKKVLAAKDELANPMPVAIVLNSAIARMLAGLMLRANNHKSEYFKNEVEALAWLDAV